MKQYNFDEIIDRKHTNSVKHAFVEERGYPADAIPLWIADMDFRVPDPVLEVLHKTVDHGIFGYSSAKKDYYEALSGWFLQRFGWQTQLEWLVKTPGVVFALAIAVRALTQPGDSILIQPPVYHPFFSAIQDNGRAVVENGLIYQNGRYSIDFADFEAQIVQHQVKLFILCSPHNPIGRIWTRDELVQLGRICKKHGVLVVSDEIHCDFAFPEHPHTVFLEANPDMADQTIICTAPSKTFNLAGLHASNIWIPGEDLRGRFHGELARVGNPQPNLMGIVACQAAYQHGGEWLEQCKTYLRGNLNFLRDFLAKRIPQIKLVEPEGTYFAWIDCSALGLSQEDLNGLISNRAKLWLDAGHIFGACAGQFQRMVLACPRKTLEQALVQLEQAVRGIGAR